MFHPYPQHCQSAGQPTATGPNLPSTLKTTNLLEKSRTSRALPPLQLSRKRGDLAACKAYGSGAQRMDTARPPGPGRRATSCPAPSIVILTSSTNPAQFGAELNSHRFIAKADIRAAAIAVCKNPKAGGPESPIADTHTMRYSKV